MHMYICVYMHICISPSLYVCIYIYIYISNANDNEGREPLVAHDRRQHEQGASVPACEEGPGGAILL